MSPHDTARSQQAIDLAKSGQIKMAYDLFLDIYSHGNTQDVTLLYWLAYTTTSKAEAQNFIDLIAYIEPIHPKLQELQIYVDRKRYNAPALAGPIMACPYCRYTVPCRVAGKVSIGGWIWFSAFFLLFLLSLLLATLASTMVTTQTSSMNCVSFFFLFISFIGFFIRKRSYICGHYGIALGDIAY